MIEDCDACRVNINISCPSTEASAYVGLVATKGRVRLLCEGYGGHGGGRREGGSVGVGARPAWDQRVLSDAAAENKRMLFISLI